MWVAGSAFRTAITFIMLGWFIRFVMATPLTYDHAFQLGAILLAVSLAICIGVLAWRGLKSTWE